MRPTGESNRIRTKQRRKEDTKKSGNINRKPESQYTRNGRKRRKKENCSRKRLRKFAGQETRRKQTKS
jgi:hypothetical protein